MKARSILPTLALMVLATGCTGATGAFADLNSSILRPEHVRGTYSLLAFGGQALPAENQLPGTDECPIGGTAVRSVLAEGHLVLAADGGIRFSAEATLHCTAGADDTRTMTVPQDMEGTFMVSSDQIRVRLPGGTRMTLAYDSARGEIRSEELGAVWRKGGPQIVQTQNEPARERQATNLPPQCVRHPDLADLPDIPPADTAGLGDRISTGFPGWRLSTEAELGCRAIVTRAPVDWYKGWKSGSAWWVWHADFNGDGQTDILTVLTDESDPLNARLVVLHAVGDAHVVTDLPGGIFPGVVPAGHEIRGCRVTSTGELVQASFTMPAAGISISNEMTWGETFLWADGKYQYLETVTGVGGCS